MLSKFGVKKNVMVKEPIFISESTVAFKFGVRLQLHGNPSTDPASGR
jgi:hypothetical protein